MKRTRVLIMGAAGRDFHNFNVVFRDNPQYEVIAFTATQIPNIEGRRYPPELAGALYPEGLPIYPEEELERLIEEYEIDQVVFSYSDVSHEHVMHEAARALARGADFRLLGARATMLRAQRPVISVCAVRTGCGKSPASRKIARLLREMGRRVVVVRHPMPYGDLSQQIVQRFETVEDLRRYNCTIEEMEEYEPHLRNGVIVYAGVDYERILRQAEAEADVLVWDGGNNDLPFFVPDLEIVLVDPHRPGHERAYFPGEVNFLRADVLIISKVNTARPEDVEAVRQNIRAFNPKALVIEANLPIVVDAPEAIRHRRVLVVEDGPTLTHGEMSYGAGVLAARQYGARELIDPRPYAVGSIRETFAEYPHIGPLLPAMGYGAEQMRELEETINRTPCDVVLVATPVDLRRVLQIRHPTCRVAYELEEVGPPTLGDVLRDFLARMNA
ncbi:MAG: cyclic 2,3-diphosphoglycerate synthase [Blastocatellia bacterium]|nr:cyclic 2,3-diphosphoglycerate synthase [Blastocatellia bacterium]MCX7751525.1 cyclic 2,3-diphosphoglycerate synthase [Blastocatellia bacterium]MDW8168625.1 cyclic 2,3-diphosphoglycerate synthase [Acidobacteriota bacterium]MDW8256520.1 cyclic 2,3-diphosphoglycerate synthase [Acidobacteriota bacterium]